MVVHIMETYDDIYEEKGIMMISMKKKATCNFNAFESPHLQVALLIWIQVRLIMVCLIRV